LEQGPPGLPNVPNPSMINNIADETGTILNDSAFTLTNPFSIMDSNANNLISIDYDNTTCNIAGIYDNMSSTGDHHLLIQIVYYIHILILLVGDKWNILVCIQFSLNRS
jgi:hypothetical protein